MLLLASSVFSVSHFLLMFADLGHYILFNKGILHRDISSDSILCYLEPIWCPSLDR